MDFLSSLKRQTLVLALCYLLIGTFFVVCPGTAAVTIVRIIAIAALIVGIIKIVEFFSAQKYEKPFGNTLTIGVVASAVAVFMLLQPQVIVSIIYVLIGIALVISGIVSVQSAIDLRHFRENKHLVLSVLGLVTLLLGILVLFNPFPTAKAMLFASGIFFLIGGITNIVSLFYIHSACGEKRE